MGKTIKQKLKEFSPERQNKIRERADDLIAEEMTRQQLRQLFKITQEQMAQGGVYRIEHRFYLMVSTPHKYVTSIEAPLSERCQNTGHYEYIKPFGIVSS